MGLLLVFAASAFVFSAPGAQAARADTGLLPGIDVSNWQRQIDWLAVAGTGQSFVFAKATEGTTFTDVTFAINRSGAKVAGLRFGAYHFARPSGTSDAAAIASAIAQADHFLEVAEPRRFELLPVLDLENTGNLSVARLSLWTQAWLSHVVTRTKVKPIVYVSPSFWKERVGDSPVVAAAGHRLWIAHWTKASLPILPGASWGGLGWSFWQWSSCQKIDGIVGCVDANRFNGSSLASVSVPAYPAGPPVGVAAPTIMGTPQVGRPLAGVPGTWGGGKPISFAYQWQRCDASGRNCTPITSATSGLYSPTAADAGRALRVSVTATSSSGAASATSAQTLAVAGSGAPVGAAPRALKLPSVQGGTQVGETLTGSVGSWAGSPSSFSYQWRRCSTDGTACSTIPAAGGSSYTITPGDIDFTLSLTVTALGKGGAGSATSPLTPVVTAAPVPAPDTATSVARAGQAGAIVTRAGVATATWQPGALPDGAAVALADITSKLALQGTVTRLSFGAPSPLPWPIDVQYASAPADVVPGILPFKGVWQPLGELPSPILPAGQDAGAYRDAAGTLHVLTRTGGRIALFAAGRWGDPRFTTTSRPRIALATTPSAAAQTSGGGIALVRITLDTQAHLYVSLTAANGAKLMLPQQGARIGWWLKGKPAKTLQALQLAPGSLPIRLRVPAAQWKAPGPYTLRVVAVDPYGRKSTLTATVPR